jgi:hypothetical protein
MALMLHSRICKILLKLIFALIPKHVLTLMICSPITKILKNIGSQEEIISKVEKQQIVIKILRQDFLGTT